LHKYLLKQKPEKNAELPLTSTAPTLLASFKTNYRARKKVMMIVRQRLDWQFDPSLSELIAPLSVLITVAQQSRAH